MNYCLRLRAWINSLIDVNFVTVITEMIPIGIKILVKWWNEREIEIVKIIAVAKIRFTICYHGPDYYFLMLLFVKFETLSGPSVLMQTWSTQALTTYCTFSGALKSAQKSFFQWWLHRVTPLQERCDQVEKNMIKFWNWLSKSLLGLQLNGLSKAVAEYTIM